MMILELFVLVVAKNAANSQNKLHGPHYTQLPMA